MVYGLFQRLLLQVLLLLCLNAVSGIQITDVYNSPAFPFSQGCPRLHPHISPVPADKPEGIVHLITGLLKFTVGGNHTLDVIRMEAVKGAVHIYLIKLFPGHPGYVQKSLADKNGIGHSRAGNLNGHQAAGGIIDRIGIFRQETVVLLPGLQQFKLCFFTGSYVMVHAVQQWVSILIAYDLCLYADPYRIPTPVVHTEFEISGSIMFRSITQFPHCRLCVFRGRHC